MYAYMTCRQYTFTFLSICHLEQESCVIASACGVHMGVQKLGITDVTLVCTPFYTSPGMLKYLLTLY